MWAGILETIKNLFKVLAYFFNPKLRKQREREKIWKLFKNIEKEYRRALKDGDPMRVAQLDKEMREMRAKYKFLRG